MKNTELQIKYHKKHHVNGKWTPKFTTCHQCSTARTKCGNKVTYQKRLIADKSAIKHNMIKQWWPDDSRIPYRCIWCAKWHLTTPASEFQFNKLEKMRSKWLRKTGQKDTDNKRYLFFLFYKEEEMDIDWLEDDYGYYTEG